jgi:hypothetical protein
VYIGIGIPRARFRDNIKVGITLAETAERFVKIFVT